MHCYKLTIAYDGTRFSGWQIQPNGISIQEHIQDALKTILQTESIKLIGSGRTDRGVHALGQTAHFLWPVVLDLKHILYSLNGILTQDIRVKLVESAPQDFHARYSAIGKEYHYRLHLDRVMDPFKRLYCWHVHRLLDVEILKQACTHFVGTHDFTTFANEAHSGSAAKNPVRTIHRIDVVEEPGGLRLEFEGNGFLYKMVRNIVGTVVDMASGRRELKEIDELFMVKDRRKACAAAPSQGLFLVRVNY